MKTSILDDYHDTLRTLDCFHTLDRHDVTVWNDHVQDTGPLADRLKDTEALVLAAILFLWQFPHFMAIAWLYRQEYARAGQRMLTVVDPTGLRAGGSGSVWCGSGFTPGRIARS